MDLQSQKNARLLVAIAGPPGSGKSTLSEALVPLINETVEKELATVLPMDGFHFDNTVLDERQIRDRKGSPPSFDSDGFLQLITRVAATDAAIAVPVFDREMDLSRAGARIVAPYHQIVIVEGNYLLLDQSPWNELHPLFDYRVYLDVAEDVLTQRLTQRWIDLKHTPQAALKRAESNDLPNARLVASCRLAADEVISAED